MHGPPYRSAGASPAPPPPEFPAPPPPEGGYGCPRCGSPHTTDAPESIGGMGLLLSALNQTMCNTCGYAFNAKTGKSTAPILIAFIAAPLVIAFALVALFYALASR